MDEEWERLGSLDESWIDDEFGGSDNRAGIPSTENEWDLFIIDSIWRKVIYVFGAPITSQDYPPCLGSSHPDCEECSFVFEDAYGRCQLRKSRRLRSLLREVIAPWLENERRKTALRDAIERELRLHGRELHYSIIARIVEDRYPNLHANELSVYRTLRLCPDTFRRVAPGVYRAASS